MIAWQQRRFRDHWRRLSQRGTPGRPAIAKDVRDLIRRMWRANPTWGSTRIVGELRKLGIEVAKSTVEKYRGRPRTRPSPGWQAFLKEGFNQVVTSMSHTLLYSPLRTDMSMSEREDGDAGMSPVPE